MRKQIILSVILFAVGAFFTQANAQSSSISAKSTAEIVDPISVIDNSGLAGGTTLNFGKISILPTSGGSCIISTQNVRTVTGGVSEIGGSATSTASFGIVGKLGATYVITVPVGSINLTREGGAEIMTVSNFLASPMSAGADQLTGTLIGGTDSFTVGGTLNVNAAQPEGVYTGTFNVTVAYN